ncbi:MAG: DUF1549 domain-containing protein, partial [Planctomycetales bacterium]|nr:DUF1549 domain-containing protein [Planctomycetales bacterium]
MPVDALATLRAAQPNVHYAVSDKPNAWRRFLAGEPLASPLAPAAEAAPAEAGASRAPAGIASTIEPSIARRLADSAADVSPDFQRHVLPMLGRLGCNGRSCHGSFQGRGGFRLSMFGYDFAADLEAMTAGEEPRVSKDKPEESLLLYKPTHGDEHGGGKRLEQESWQYQLLKRWIASGAEGTAEPAKLARLEVEPSELRFARVGESTQLRCIATWQDGRREDVTDLTRFQSNDPAVSTVEPGGLARCVSAGETHIIAFYDNGVTPVQTLLPISDQRVSATGARTEVDRLVLEKLGKLGIAPSPACSDAEFLRRVSLDIAGTLPTPAEVSDFVADESLDKRDRAIERLLESPAYAEWWTVWLSDLTGSNSQYLGTTDMNQPASEQWNRWLRRRVADNVGWDRIAAGILLAKSREDGESYASYAAGQSRYLSRTDPADFTDHANAMHYYWFRSNNQLSVDRALSFGYVFLGVRLQCAQCHKHPFDQWSQQDFNHFAAFFDRIKTGAAPDALPAQQMLKTKLGVPERLNTAALRRQMYLRVSAEGLPIPWNEVWIEPPRAKPQPAKLLGDAMLDLNDYADPREPLVSWLLSRDNPYFARAMVNRIWKHHFGVGIVEPPDDLNRANPPSNAALLDHLASEFVEQQFDLKWLHREICRSDAYQRSWRTNATNRADTRNFSHALIRRLPAEVTVDAIQQATSDERGNSNWSQAVASRKIAQHPKSIQARGIDYSLLIFGKPLRTTNCDCERQAQPTLLQSLYVRNDQELLEWLQRKDGWLQQVARERGESLSSDTVAGEPTAAPATGDTASSASDDELKPLIRTAYLRSVSRAPDASELRDALEHLRRSNGVAEGLRDLMWALLNTQEFLTNH